MSDLKRFDMNGTPHVSGQYCNAQEAADLIESQQQRIAELERINSEWAKVTQPAFDYVDACEIAKLGKSKIGALVESHKALAAHVERLHCEFDKGSGDPSILWEILENSPTTSLNAVRLNALMDFRHDCGSMNGYHAVDVWDKMDEYIKREFS